MKLATSLRSTALLRCTASFSLARLAAFAALAFLRFGGFDELLQRGRQLLPVEGAVFRRLLDFRREIVDQLLRLVVGDAERLGQLGRTDPAVGLPTGTAAHIQLSE